LSLLELKGVQKRYGSRTALDDINLSIEQGEVVFVIGPSGSGKSTLLKCCNLLERPTSGEIVFEGQDITQIKKVDRVRQRMGMVFQSFNLYPHMTAYWNIAVALRVVQRLPKSVADATVARQLDRVGLAERSQAYPSQLSGGEQQRVAIARALALQPKLMLFDEPTSALDPELVGSVLDVIREVRNDGMTMIVVSHEMNFAREAADRILFMSDGRIVEQGTPDQLFGDPREVRTRAFLARTRQN
jgi:ABC-type polar amino acid transport system ATPase subunit